MSTYCYRHGESLANAGGITGDPASIPLTEIGRSQAMALAAACACAPELIVTSPFQRTRETAQPMIERFPDAALEVWDIQEFTYLSPPRCRNSTREARRPMVDAYWNRCEPNYVDGPGAESFSAFATRVENAMTTLRNQERLICIFGHEQFMQAMMLWVLAGSLHASAAGMQQFLKFRERNPIANGQCVRLAQSDGNRFACETPDFVLSPTLSVSLQTSLSY